MTIIAVHNNAHVLVSDGRKALLLQNHGDPDLLDLRVVEARVDENPATRDQGTDAPGRAFSSVGMGARSAVESSDWHEIEKEHFARELAERLDAAVESGELKELVIVAPPRALGELRHRLSARTAARVVGEIGKDLTHHPLPGIEKALSRAFTQGE